MSRWLVGSSRTSRAGVLDEGAGDQGALALAAGERGVRAVGEAGEADAGEGGVGVRAVGGGVALPEALVRGAAQGDQFADGELEVGAGVLGDGGDAAGAGLGAEGAQVVAVEEGASRGGGEGAVDAAQEGGLAAAVGADEADGLAGADGEVDRAEAVLVRESLQAQFGHRGAPSGRRRISQRKNGPPMRAVRTPTGRSWGR